MTRRGVEMTRRGVEMTRRGVEMTRRGVEMTINNPRPFESGIVRVLRICVHQDRHLDDRLGVRHEDRRDQDHRRSRMDSYHPQRG